MKEVGWAGFPGGPVVRTSCFHCLGLRVQSLVRDFISCMSWGMAKKRGGEDGGTGWGTSSLS